MSATSNDYGSLGGLLRYGAAVAVATAPTVFEVASVAVSATNTIVSTACETLSAVGNATVNAAVGNGTMAAVTAVATIASIEAVSAVSNAVIDAAVGNGKMSVPALATIGVVTAVPAIYILHHHSDKVVYGASLAWDAANCVSPLQWAGFAAQHIAPPVAGFTAQYFGATEKTQDRLKWWIGNTAAFARNPISYAGAFAGSYAANEELNKYGVEQNSKWRPLVQTGGAMLGSFLAQTMATEGTPNKKTELAKKTESSSKTDSAESTATSAPSDTKNNSAFVVGAGLKVAADNVALVFEKQKLESLENEKEKQKAQKIKDNTLLKERIKEEKAKKEKYEGERRNRIGVLEEESAPLSFNTWAGLFAFRKEQLSPIIAQHESLLLRGSDLSFEI